MEVAEDDDAAGVERQEEELAGDQGQREGEDRPVGQDEAA
jgi:hypothetical protein